jgi:hypothetical protein
MRSEVVLSEKEKGHAVELALPLMQALKRMSGLFGQNQIKIYRSQY